MRPWIALLLLGCGAAQAPAQDPGPSAECVAARDRSASAWTRVAELAEPPPASETPIDSALAALRAHVDALRASPPEEVDGEAAMALSGQVMDALDAIEGVPREQRHRADDAAEAILTDRSVAGSFRAARHAANTLEAALEAADPAAAAARIRADRLATLRRRATATAESYAEDAQLGDRRAQRSEALPVPEGLDALDEALADAGEAGRATREACGFHRSIAVPSI